MASNIGSGLLQGGQRAAQAMQQQSQQPMMRQRAPQGYLQDTGTASGGMPTPFSDPNQISIGEQSFQSPQGMLRQQAVTPQAPNDTAVTMNPKPTDQLKFSPMGEKTLIMSEGMKTKPYKDSQGNWTVGIGHLITDPSEKHTYTPDEVHALLQKDLPKYEEAVTKAVKVPITQNQYDALVHFTFNVGTGGLAKSSIVKNINAGRMDEAANGFLKYVKQPELLGRRQLEQRMFIGK